MSRHPEIADLLPWYVNGTASETDRVRVEAHVQECASCRAELDFERGVEHAMRTDNGIEYMPTASLKRLQSMLDGAAPARVETPARRPTVAVPYKVAAAALVAVGALGVLMLSRTRDLSAPDATAEAGYHTVTTPGVHVRGEVIRAVFSPAITLTELERILGEAHLRIVSGPTEAGVYSLAGDSSVPVVESLRMLRQHDVVRFAESTHPVTEPEAAR